MVGRGRRGGREGLVYFMCCTSRLAEGSGAAVFLLTHWPLTSAVRRTLGQGPSGGERTQSPGRVTAAILKHCYVQACNGVCVNLPFAAAV